MEKPLHFRTIKEGMLWKKTPPNKSYKKFWVVLGSSCLYFYKNAKDTIEVGNIPLAQVTIERNTETTKSPYPFELYFPDGTRHFLASDSTREREQWIQCLDSYTEGFFSDHEEEEAIGCSKSISAFKREKLLLSYRFMKSKVEMQSNPQIIYLPEEEVMHRFGYEIAIRKLFKTNESLNTLYFKDSRFAGDFLDDLLVFLDSYDRISSLVFDNGVKGAFCDAIAVAMPLLPYSITSVAFIGSLSAIGIRSLSIGLENQETITSLIVHNAPLKTEMANLANRINSSAIEILDLSHTDIGDAAIAPFIKLVVENKSLRKLTLSHVNLTRASRDPLVQLLLSDIPLTSLDLSGNRLAEASEDIFDALSKEDHLLKKLNLADNKITHNSIFALCQMLQANNSLYSLNMSENKLKEDSARVVCVAMISNHTLCQLKTRNAFRSIRPEDTAFLKNKLQENHERAENRLINMSSHIRSPTAVIKENRPKFKLLCSLLDIEISDSVTHVPSFFSSKIWEQCQLMVKESIEKGVSLLQCTTMKEEEVIYLCGTTKEIIKQILNTLGMAQSLRMRAPSWQADPNATTKTSYMFKRGGKIQSWKRRWFCLSGQYIFYYVNESRSQHKGTIVLAEAVVVRDVQGMTDFSFSIQTTTREYLLSCDSDEDRQSWIEAIKTQAKNLSETYAPLDSLKELMEEFSEAHSQLRSDPHVVWILQWWFPIALEILSRFYSRRKQEVFPELFDFFVQQSTLAIYLLTGLIRAVNDHEDVKVILMERMKSVHSSFLYSISRLNDTLSSISLSSLLELWESAVELDPLLAQPQCISSHKVCGRPSLRQGNALLDSFDIGSVLRPILERTNMFTMEQLLFLQKKMNRAQPDAPSRLKGTDRRRNISSVLAQGFDNIDLEEENIPFRSILFPPVKRMCSKVKENHGELFFLLQEIQPARPFYKPTYKLIMFLDWLAVEWPTSQNKRVTDIPVQQTLFSMRMVFILWSLFKDLKKVSVSIDNMELFNIWTDFRGVGDALIAHLASCCVYGFDGQDPVISLAFEYFSVAITSTLLPILASLLK